MLTFFHPDQILHQPKSYYSRGGMRPVIEVPSRLTTLVDTVKALGYEVREPADHGMRPIEAVHDAGYLRFLESAHRKWMAVPEGDWGDEVMSNIFVRQTGGVRGGVLGEAAQYLADGTCPVGEHTWRAAYWSAQSAIAAAEAINQGEQLAYALCRPPGHHARIDAAGGACYLNNAAIAAEVLRKRFGRVVILDTDMHHGQGIQEIFYHRSDVFYISTHGHPENFYPVVTGYDDEQGEGEGRSYNLNLPIPHGSSEEVFVATLDQALTAVRLYEPDVIVHCHGFDIFRDDVQSKVDCSQEIFALLGSRLRELNVPCLVVQEGGYDLDSLEDNARTFFSSLKS